MLKRWNYRRENWQIIGAQSGSAGLFLYGLTSTSCTFVLSALVDPRILNNGNEKFCDKFFV